MLLIKLIFKVHYLILAVNYFNLILFNFNSIVIYLINYGFRMVMILMYIIIINFRNLLNLFEFKVPFIFFSYLLIFTYIN
jgi:hypothetical protein